MGDDMKPNELMTRLKEPEKPKGYNVPLWLVIVFIVPMIFTSVTTVVNAMTSKSSSDNALIYEKLSANAETFREEKEAFKVLDVGNVERDKRITDIEKLLAEVVANQKNVIKILDRLERR